MQRNAEVMMDWTSVGAGAAAYGHGKDGEDSDGKRGMGAEASGKIHPNGFWSGIYAKEEI